VAAARIVGLTPERYVFGVKTTVLRTQVSSRTARLRSPLPLLVGGVMLALMLILFTQYVRDSRVEPPLATTLSDREALTTVAEKMRTGEAGRRVMNEGSARFEDGAWRIVVGDAQFHFSARNRIVVADNDAATVLEFGGG